MKITIDLEDFWMDNDEGTLTEQIKDHINHNVKNEVWKQIEILAKDYLFLAL